MISVEQFTAAIGGLLEVLPMQRRLSEGAILMLWETMQKTARLDLTTGMLGFAVGQRLLDPDPPKELALHLALLRYLYPLEHNRPVVERGLRPDLPERMRQPEVFHDPAPVREEFAAASTRALRLPGGSRPWHPSEMTAQQRAAHLQQVEAAMQRLRERGDDGRDWKATDPRLARGMWWFERCLDGFWPLEADDGGITSAWILVNGRLADELLQQAQSAPGVLPPAEGLAVAGISVQGLNSWR